ncbi:50S ribosomal protein L17 [Candidatus Parcubacteria bacterium]|nr:50S ribosomal protein L17 [Candidatus Parcubacteria bacterium]
MRHRKAGRKFGRPFLKGLATALILRGKIKTTEARAKELRRFLEPLITKSKSGPTQSVIREVRRMLPAAAAFKMAREIGPRFADRPGGYTRLTRLPPRASDGAPQMVIEFVA